MTSELFKVSKKVPLIDDDGDLVNKELGIKLKGLKRLGRCNYQRKGA